MNETIIVLVAMIVSFLIGFMAVVLFQGSYLFKALRVRLGNGRRILVNVLQTPGVVIHYVGNLDDDTIWYKQGKAKIFIKNDADAIYREMMIPQVDVYEGSPLPYRRKDSDLVPHEPKIFDNILQRALTRKIPGMDMNFRLLLLGIIVVALLAGFTAYTVYNLDQKVLLLEQAIGAVKTIVAPVVQGGVAP